MNVVELAEAGVVEYPLRVSCRIADCFRDIPLGSVKVFPVPPLNAAGQSMRFKWGNTVRVRR